MRFRFGETDIEFSFWFFAVVAVFASLYKDVLALYFMIPVIIHESGHLIAIAVFRVKIAGIRFTAFGVDIKKSQQPGLSPGVELIILLAGALANLAGAAGVYFFAPQSMRSMLFVSINIAVAVFNLLPIGNLDGGGIAKAVSEYYFEPRTAFVISRLFSFFALAPLFAAAIFLILTPHRNFTLLLICAYLLCDVMVNS